jgi:glycosyltransferase involved in cell wall biosynthesis
LLEFLDLYRSAVNKQNITYLLAGDGELREEIEQFCQNNNLNVRLLGYKEEDDMLELYAIADVFILPSLGDPNPLTCIEACYSSLPLFISRHIGSYPEVIKNETNGYVFSYDDRADATEKLNSLIHAPNDWLIAAGSASHTIAETVFNPRLQIERIVQELENLPS